MKLFRRQIWENITSDDTDDIASKACHQVRELVDDPVYTQTSEQLREVVWDDLDEIN